MGTVLLTPPQDTKEMPHGRASLFDHLTGTHGALHAWGCESDVCIAGLIHSVYSTEEYHLCAFPQTDEHRYKLQISYGHRAEHLAYLFCNVDRQALWRQLRNDPRALIFDNTGFKISRTDASSLLLIECANFAEQFCSPNLGPHPWMCWLASWIGYIDRLMAPRLFDLLHSHSVSYDNEVGAIAAYELSLENIGEDRRTYLRDAIALNPIAFEPRLLLAIEDGRLGKDMTAENLRDSGLRLLRLWGVAWDKRKSIDAWAGTCVWP